MQLRRMGGTLAAVLALTGAAQDVAADETDGVEEERSPLLLDLGGGTTVQFYGFVKADFIWDRGYDLGRTTSSIKNIGLPTGPVAGDFDRQQLNETRIGFDVRGPNNVFAKFEGDFYGPNNNLRLRHAYLDWYGVIIGQNWTNFMSLENLADTVDFQGSGAVPFARVPQVRYTYTGLQDWTLSASVEEDTANSDKYWTTAAVRYGFERGMVRLSGLWRDEVPGTTDVNGWGVMLGTVISPWQGGQIKAAYTTGEGISDILAAGLGGRALAQTGQAVGVDAVAVTVSQQVAPKLRLALTGSWVDVDRATGTDTAKLETVHLSAFYAIRDDTVLMAEYFTGTRTQGNGADFDADRMQLAVKWSF